MKLWIARDQNNDLYLYPLEPKRDKNTFIPQNHEYMKIPSEEFPDVTWENSPQNIHLVQVIN